MSNVRKELPVLLAFAMAVPPGAELMFSRNVAAITAPDHGLAAPVALQASGCPTHYYLGNNPDGTDWPDWSENAQGIANDGKHWFFTRVNGLFQYDPNWTPVDGPDAGKLRSVSFPPVLESLGINHFGDPDQYRGYLFVPFEGDDRAIIAAYRAADLEFLDWVDVFPYQPKAGWVAIDPVERLLYTSDDELVAGTPLLRYSLDVAKIENGIQGDFLSPASPMTVLDANGSPVTGRFIYMQGGVFTPWGDLYLSAGKAGDSPSDTRGGIHLFRRTADASAFQLVESSVNVDDHVGDPVFAYKYDPGITGLGEEPEGIDWWNRDNAPGSLYKGQLHAILLDNQAYDDQIWLKHYAVDYHCVAGADTDGDGLTDYNEAYVYNTHPLLKDTDGDGQGDGDEVVCGSDPLDASSVSADFDRDGIPDCADPDDDNDAVVDGNDRCPATLIPDPLIPTTGVLKSNRYALVNGDLVFDGGAPTAPEFTTLMTGGCNATQIADALGLGRSHYESGITRSVLEAWIADQR